MVNPLVVIVHSHGEDLLGKFLANDVPVQIFHDFLRRWRRLSLTLSFCVLDGLLGVHFAEHHEEVVTFFALYEPR